MDRQPGSDAGVNEAEDARACGHRIEQLLDATARIAGPTIWPRVEELVRSILELQKIGLGRILEHASGAVAETERDAFRSNLCADELVSSLLLLHGLHPLSLEDRIRGAVEELNAHFDAQSKRIELVDIRGSAARVRVVGPQGGCASSSPSIEQMVRRAVEDAAPEVDEVVIELASESKLVQLRIRKGETEE